MLDYPAIEKQLARVLRLESRPVAIAFLDTPPDGVARFTGKEPAGCSFWRLAAQGRTFYTVPSDHFNCAVGSYTHNFTLSPERAKELGQTLSFLTGIGYLRMDEVPEIPRLTQRPGVVIFAPVGDTPVDPDVVLFAGRPGRVMLLQEAAFRAGLPAHMTMLGRPTCAALPAALTNGLVASVGCVGNRVYTDLGEDEMYVVVPGRYLARIAAEAETVATANATLYEYHLERRQILATE
jgi:uncharacterized protein (DUF169 family)